MMMMMGAPLIVNFSVVGTIVCSKGLRLTVTWSDSYSSGSDAAAGKEGRRAAQSHVRNGTILSSDFSAAACAVIRVYVVGGER